MDAAGARALRTRIAQHEHWQQAEAVRDGRQPAQDPDLLLLTECRDGVRVYAGDGGSRRFVKHLVAGSWQTIGEP